MGDEDAGLAQQRLELERERLALDRRRANIEGRFLNRNFGALITAVISLLALIISALQVFQTVTTAKQNAAAQVAENDREWSLKVASFVSEYRDLMLSHDRDHVLLARTAIDAALPRPLALRLTSALSDGSTDSTSRGIWSEARAEVISRIREDLQQRLKALDRSQTPKQLKGAERILRGLGCDQIRLTGSDYLTGILPDGLEVAVFAGTYGKPGKYGIRFGSPDRGRPYFGSNDTYFEFPP